MRSKLIIDGNAVYEIDEDCMLRKSREEAHNMEKKLEKQAYEKKEMQKTDAKMRATDGRGES